GFVPWPRSQGLHIGGFERQGFRLGLDLQGGTDVQLQADLSQIPPADRGNALQGAKQVIERRVNAFGVAETVIQTLGDDRISIQLPGVRDRDEAVRLIGQTAKLEFKERPATAVDASEDKPVDLTGADLSKAYAGLQPQTNQPVVNFEFKDRGAKVFGDLSTRLDGTGG